MFFPSAAWALHQWAILLLPEVTRLLFPPSEKCMSSSHCLLASVALSCLLHEVFCLERSCLSLVSHPNAIKHTCLFLQLLTCCWGTKKEQTPQQEGHFKSLHRGCHSTAGDSRGRGYALYQVITVWVLSNCAKSPGSLVCQVPS